MKKFIFKTVLFVAFFMLIILSGLIIPTTPRASLSLLMSSIKKDLLLSQTPSPRIIFIGGSNLSFGLNSKEIRDSLNLNPINTAIHASIGIKFMMDNAIKFIRKGDVVVLVPEYDQYYRDINYGSEELMRMVFDVNIDNLRVLSFNQIMNILPFLPKYSFSKFQPSEYFFIKESDVYSLNSFNDFGDAHKHWGMSMQNFKPVYLGGHLNHETIKYINKFHIKIKEKNALFFISFPCYQASSFDNSTDFIINVEQELKKSGLPIVGSAERYKMDDELMFDTPYHLSKKGVDYRTMLLIEDLRKVLTHKNAIIQY